MKDSVIELLLEIFIMQKGFDPIRNNGNFKNLIDVGSFSRINGEQRG